MTDIFISYSRKDSDFMRRLHEALTTHQRDIWVDWEDIPLSADWWKEICAGIEAAESFMFIISPDGVRSEVCQREIDYAVSHNKRIVPVLRHELTAEDQSRIHPAVRSHNWIFFREEDAFDKSVAALLKAIDTDLSYVREHTRLLVRAKEWESKNRDTSLLLRGSDLIEAESWLIASAGKEPQPLDLHKQFIALSRKSVNARQRTTIGALIFGLLIASALAVFAFIQWQAAADNAVRANDNAATATFALGLAADNAATAYALAAIADSNAATAVAAVATIEGYIPKAVVEDGPLRMREGPGQNYTIIRLLQKGATVSVLGRTGRQGTETEYTEWYLVEWENGGQKVKGWIAAQFTNQNTQLTIEVPVIDPAPVTN